MFTEEIDESETLIRNYFHLLENMDLLSFTYNKETQEFKVSVYGASKRHSYQKSLVLDKETFLKLYNAATTLKNGLKNIK